MYTSLLFFSRPSYLFFKGILILILLVIGIDSDFRNGELWRCDVKEERSTEVGEDFWGDVSSSPKGSWTAPDKCSGNHGDWLGAYRDWVVRCLDIWRVNIRDHGVYWPGNRDHSPCALPTVLTAYNLYRDELVSKSSIFRQWVWKCSAEAVHAWKVVDY